MIDFFSQYIKMSNTPPAKRRKIEKNSPTPMNWMPIRSFRKAIRPVVPMNINTKTIKVKASRRAKAHYRVISVKK
jgi:hypothetical protein